jgi:lipopolysaccharide export system protein LptC
MSWWTRVNAAGIGLLLAAGVGGRAEEPLVPAVMKGIRLPQYDAQGRLESQLIGESAEPQPDGKIKVTNLRLEVYKEGVLDAVLWAASCVLDQKDRSVVSDSDVRIERPGAVIRGRGLRWDNARQQARILEQVRVELQHASLWTQTQRKP